MADKLTELARHAVVVAGSGDIAQVEARGAQDSTTNPSLILKAVSRPEYAALMDDAVRYASVYEARPEARIDLAVNKLAVNFGTELSRIAPGCVSIEVDARLSFDTAATISRAERLITLYRKAGVDRARILIRIAATIASAEDDPGVGSVRVARQLGTRLPSSRIDRLVLDEAGFQLATQSGCDGRRESRRGHPLVRQGHGDPVRHARCQTGGLVRRRAARTPLGSPFHDRGGRRVMVE